MAQCTRCFGPLDRKPATFAERFSDSAWCKDCLAEWLTCGVYREPVMQLDDKDVLSLATIDDRVAVP